MGLFFILFAAGVLTILLPCILPLIPIVVGVSIVGRNPWRPALTALGMLVSFVAFTFLLFVVLHQFVETADYLRLGTYYVLLLFGLGFLTHHRGLQAAGATAGALFFWDKGVVAMLTAALLGVVALFAGGRIALRIQGVGADVQQGARKRLGAEHPLTAFLIGLTLGLVWVPCAGPALSFAFTLVRDEPGLRAFGLLTAYGAGTALPLFLVGYGGQRAVHSVRFLSQWSGHIKRVSGILLLFTAVALRLHWFTALETWFVTRTPFGSVGTDLELRLFGEEVGRDVMPTDPSLLSPSVMNDNASSLPRLSRAPELRGLGPWHNSEGLLLEELRGKVVLVDFWTYSCINCIRTLPYIQGYWDAYGVQGADGLLNLERTPFVVIGVHTPEFIFEKSEHNVAAAIERHGLTYPVAQDNDYETWRAFANRYWPAKYLIDAEGYIRYTHFGEGAYEETADAIEELLREAGLEAEEGGYRAGERTGGTRMPLTAETYLGERSWQALGSGSPSPVADPVSYTEPHMTRLHHYYLVGDWQLRDGERQVLLSEDGAIRMRFLGGEINLVLGLEEEGGYAEADVYVDDTFVQSLVIDRPDLYRLYEGPYGEHELSLRIKGAGVAGYAFTFGQ